MRALIVENMQNCFFSNGSMAFMSQNSSEEKEFVKTINKLINFNLKDENYILAGKSGLKKMFLIQVLERSFSMILLFLHKL